MAEWEKGRFSLAVQREGVAQTPADEDWKTPPMNNALMFDYIRYNGVIRGSNIFFRAQSGHTNIRRAQRPGVEYDFRHNMLMHKTTAYKFEDIKASRHLKVMGGRDIHLVPVEFLYHDPDMLRQYGERVILLNLHQEETRKALRSARETPNGYILLNEDVPIERFEAVYALEKTQWEFPFTPTTAPRYNDSHGLDDAQALCSYFSRCYNVKRPVSFEELDASLKNRVTAIGHHYEQNLRHTGVFGDAPASASAATPAQKAERRRDKTRMIDAVVQDLTSAVNEEAKKIHPKEMPKPKRDPPELPKFFFPALPDECVTLSVNSGMRMKMRSKFPRQRTRKHNKKPNQHHKPNPKKQKPKHKACRASGNANWVKQVKRAPLSQPLKSSLPPRCTSPYVQSEMSAMSISATVLRRIPDDPSELPKDVEAGKRKRNHHRNVLRASCLLRSSEQSSKPPIQR